MKYPLADYELLPKMAIVDADMMMSAPKGLTSASGIDALTHALEAYASMLATDFTDGLAKQAAQLIFEYLPACYDNGQNEPVARRKDGQRRHDGWHGRSRTRSSASATPWRTSWARSITCRTASPTRC